MIKTVYKQADSRWAKLAYPKKPCTIGGSGCGEAAMANLLISIPKYAGETPKTIYPYMKQYGSIVNGACDGTKRAGEVTAFKHYGFTDVHYISESDPISKLWAELDKGNRGALLIVEGRGGSKKTLWTTGVHYICVRNYKYENGKHRLWIADSGWRNNDGWFTYEENLKGAILAAVVGKFPMPKGKVVSYKPKTAYKGKLPEKPVYYGNKSDNVKALQTFLNWRLGYKLAVDGVFGKATADAVCDFEETYGFRNYTGAFGKTCIAKAKEIVKEYADKVTVPVAKLTKAQQINETALKFAWPVGTKESAYKYPNGKPDPDFIKAWEKYFPKKKINTGCHSYVMLVLKACGYPTMDLSSWSKILSYLRKNFKEIDVNYTQAQLRAGDIRVHKNSKGGYHIWIIVEENGKFYRAEANQVGNKRYAHITTNNSGNTKRHKGDWLFRAK